MNTITSTDIQRRTLETQQINAAKIAHTARRVDKSAMATLITGEITPSVGDLVLARVTNIGHHKRLELVHGRKAPLFIGDEIILCYGHRYAPDQFEALVPDNLEPCQLVAAGGIASKCITQHNTARTPTAIEPLGLLGNNNGCVTNIRDWALPPNITQRPRPLAIGVVGTSMNAGKTTTAAHLIRGLANSGMKVGAAKVTGTGAGNDTWLMNDAGASIVLDFTDAGFVSTYRANADQLQGIVTTLTGHLREAAVDAIVIEVADGLYQDETAMLLQSDTFRQGLDGIIFAAGDAMGAAAGVAWLTAHQLPVLAISGCVSASPLASRETEQASGFPVLNLTQLASENIGIDLLGQPSGGVAGLAR